MIVKLADGTELECLRADGRQVEYQGTVRDCLIFLFDETVSLAQIESAFTVENCRRLELCEDDNIFVHEDYTLRIAYGRSYKETVIHNNSVVKENDDAVNYVKMVQTTMAERQLEQQQEVLDALLVAQLEG